MSIYPNPANTELKVSYKSDVSNILDMESPSSKSIKLYDEKGKTLLVPMINKSEKETVFDIRSIPNGTYYLHIIEGKETIKKQIIIAH